jgi:hypothetical protein
VGEKAMQASEAVGLTGPEAEEIPFGIKIRFLNLHGF